jgi:hypothetical protein
MKNPGENKEKKDVISTLSFKCLHKGDNSTELGRMRKFIAVWKSHRTENGIRGALKKFPKFFDIDGLVRNKLGIATCKFYRGCAMQFGESGATSGRQGQRFLRHDKAPCHTLLVLQQFLVERNISVIIQPPYSPDLAKSDFWLSPTLKMGLKGTRFAAMEDIKSNDGRTPKE